MSDQFEGMSPEMLEAMDLCGKAHNLAEAEAYDDASELLDRAEKLEPMCIQIYMERGSMLAVQDELEKAQEQFDKALLIDRMNGEVYYLKGNTDLLMGNARQAIENYLKAEELGYSSAFQFNNLGACLEEQEEYERAEAYYVRASELEPTWLEPHLRRVNVLMLMNRGEEAESSARDTVRDFELFEVPHNLLADVLMVQSKTDEAEKAVLHGMKFFPESPALQLRLARIYGIQERIEEEMALLEKLAARDDLSSEQRGDVEELRALNALSENEMAKAIEAYERILALETPDQVRTDARIALMTFYYQERRYEELRRVAASTLDTSEADGMLCGAYAMEALALDEMGRKEEAAALYQKAVQKYILLALQDRDRIDTHFYRVFCYIGLRDFTKAMDELTYVEQVSGENAATLTLRSKILRGMGDEKGAEEVERKLTEAEAGE